MTTNRQRMAKAARVYAAVERASATAGRQSVNRVANTVRSQAAKRTSAVYNLRQKTLRDAISIKGASKGDDTATVTLHIRAVPLTEFSPRVRMQTFKFTDSLGRKVNRRLPTVRLRIFRGGSPRYIRPAFPLRQRYSGGLAAGDTIRRRTGSARGKLTSLRYYTFPNRFLRERLMPQLRDVVDDRLGIEFRAAHRNQLRRLRGN